MEDYANYHCFGFTPNEERCNNVSRCIPPKNKRITNTAVVQANNIHKTVKIISIDLSGIKNPKASDKMFMVLENLCNSGFISDDLFMEAKDDFFLASHLIDKYQEAMHAKIHANKKRYSYCRGYCASDDNNDLFYDSGLDASFFY